LAASNSMMSNSQELMAKSTSIIARNQRIAAEKEGNENFKLKSLDTKDIIDFLAHFNPDSCQPVWKQVPSTLRDALALSLHIPIGETLESTFGFETGPESQFVRALFLLVSLRSDLDPKDLLKIHVMSDKPSLDRTSMMTMFAKVQREIKFHPGIYSVLSLVETKRALISNIRPLDFRSVLEDFADRYLCPLISITDMVEFVIKQFDKRELFLQYSNSCGIIGLANNAKFDEPRVKLTAQERMAKMTCYNCGKTGHSATICPVNCKFHNKKCSDKMACYRADRDAKKANLAVTDNAVANVSEMKSSTTVEANCFTVSSPRMNETDEVGLLDTGCNVLCMQKE
jgi:hypothetical protein